MKLIEVILCFSQTIKAKSFLPCDDVSRYEDSKDAEMIKPFQTVA